MSLPIALQLFTIRNELGSNYEQTMEQIASYGYRYVELAGLHDRTAEQVKGILDQFGLKAIATHVGLGDITNNLPQMVEQAELFGFKHIVLPFLEDKFRNPSGYRNLASVLHESAERAREADLTVCYHNHNFEFDKLEDGSQGYTILFDSPTRYAFEAELDVYWAYKAGDDPLTWLKKLSGRVPLLHIKDMADTPERGFTEIGNGIINLQSIVDEAESCGVEYLIVEQDNHWTNSPLESSRVGYENLSEMLVATTR